jgi:hypothetical protein
MTIDERECPVDTKKIIPGVAWRKLRRWAPRGQPPVAGLETAASSFNPQFLKILLGALDGLQMRLMFTVADVDASVG